MADVLITKAAEPQETPPPEEPPKERGKPGRKTADQLPMIPVVHEAPTHIVCIRCNQDKPTDEYYTAGWSKTGFNTRCKTCLKEMRDSQRLMLKNSDDEDRIDFVTEQIAMRTVAPRQEGEWPGKERIRELIKKRYQIDQTEAERIIGLAISRLYDERPDNPPRIERRMMLQRIAHVREITLKKMEQRRIIVEYEIVTLKSIDGKPQKDEKGRTMTLKIPKKMKRIRESDVPMIKAYIELEQLHLTLCGLDQAGQRDSLIGDLMEQFHAITGVESTEFRKGQGSLASQVRGKPIAELEDANQKRLTKRIEVSVRTESQLPPA